MKGELGDVQSFLCGLGQYERKESRYEGLDVLVFWIFNRYPSENIKQLINKSKVQERSLS